MRNESCAAPALKRGIRQLSTRTMNCLKSAVAHLVEPNASDFQIAAASNEMADWELLKEPNLGRGSLAEIRLWACEHGFDRPSDQDAVAVLSAIRMLKGYGYRVIPPTYLRGK